MADFAAPAGADADEKKRIDDIDGELNALDDRLRSLADSADVAASDLSGDRRGSLRLLIVWAVVSVVGTIGLGFVIDDSSLFPRLPLSMFAGVVLGFLAALPAIRRDKTRMDRIAESAREVADRVADLRSELTELVFAFKNFLPGDAKWMTDRRDKARDHGRNLASSIRTSISDRAWASRWRHCPPLLTTLFGLTVITGFITDPLNRMSPWVVVFCVAMLVLALGFITFSEATARTRSEMRMRFVDELVADNKKQWKNCIEAGVSRSSVKVASSDDD